MSTGNKRPVSVDDLLRLKRAERPPQEFWTEFERQLRAKQLAALVEKRPWWRSAPSLAALWPRVRVPLGVATVVGIGVLSMRSYQGVATVAPTVALAEIVPTQATIAASAVSLAPLEVVAAAAPMPQSASVVRDALEPTPISAFVVESAVPVTADIVIQASSSSSVAAAPVAAPSQTMLDRALVVPALVTVSPAENRVAASTPRVRIDPLQQMTPPGESRRARFQTAMVSTASIETSSRISERAASRFAEDRFQDPAGRFGARGDRVQLKF